MKRRHSNTGLGQSFASRNSHKVQRLDAWCFPRAEVVYLCSLVDLLTHVKQCFEFFVRRFLDLHFREPAFPDLRWPLQSWTDVCTFEKAVTSSGFMDCDFKKGGGTLPRLGHTGACYDPGSSSTEYQTQGHVAARCLVARGWVGPGDLSAQAAGVHSIGSCVVLARTEESPQRLQGFLGFSVVPPYPVVGDRGKQ